jgi:WD40 repeat protein
MLSRTMAGFVSLFMVLASACTSQMTQLPITTPQSTPEIATATATTIALPATETLQPTRVPADAINPENVQQIRLLHQYWLAVATAANVDPYEMDISAVATSPDGSLLAVGGCSKPIESDLRSGNVYCNGEDLESTGGIPFLLILDANTESVIGIIPENEPDTSIADLAFTKDGRKLIYAVHPGKFVVWDVVGGQIETILFEGDTSAPRIAVSPDGKWIALKTIDQVQILDTASGEFVIEIPAYFRPQFSADSGRISVYRDGEFIIYETGTWTELMRFGLPCECVYALSPDFSVFATSERAPTETESAPILVWDISTGEQIQSLEGGKNFTAFLLFSPDGRILWRAGERGDLMAWDTSDWQLVGENIGGITPIFNLRGFQFVEDGRHYILFSDLHLGLYGLP